MTADHRPLALVTGASSGIGLAMVRVLAERGWDVVLSARDRATLDAVGAELEASGGTAVVAAHDLSTPHGIDRLWADVVALGRPLELLVNNAGFGLLGPYLDTDRDAEIDMLGVNIEALVRLTRAALPGMVERGSGCVLQVGSTAGFLPGPLMATYYATKAFVLSYSDALAEELDGTGVRVTCLCPGPTRTDFQRRAGARSHGALRWGAMDADTVARAGIEGALAGRRRVVPGWFNKLSVLASRLLPRAVQARLVARIQRGRR